MFQVNVTIGFNTETLNAINALIGLQNTGVDVKSNGSAKKETPAKTKPEPAATNGQETAKAIKITLEDLRAKTVEVAKTKKEAVNKLIEKACEGIEGKASVSKIPEEKYESYYNDLKAL